MHLLRRSELARHAGVHRETIRYYESRGLLPAPARNAAGHRVYREEAVRELRLIRWAVSLGFTLADIRAARARAGTGALRELAARHARDTAREIAALRARHAQLERLARCRCKGNCPEVARALRGGP
jgi:MerR family mercuric resistance operon transcriptional regulator